VSHNNGSATVEPNAAMERTGETTATLLGGADVLPVPDPAPDPEPPELSPPPEDGTEGVIAAEPDNKGTEDSGDPSALVPPAEELVTDGGPPPPIVEAGGTLLEGWAAGRGTVRPRAEWGVGLAAVGPDAIDRPAATANPTMHNETAQRVIARPRWDFL
jgi:hypothetical protein